MGNSNIIVTAVLILITINKEMKKRTQEWLGKKYGLECVSGDRIFHDDCIDWVDAVNVAIFT